MSTRRERVQRVRFIPNRPILVRMPDGAHKLAKVSLAGGARDGRILSLAFVERGKETGETMSLYL